MTETLSTKNNNFFGKNTDYALDLTLIRLINIMCLKSNANLNDEQFRFSCLCF